MPQSMQFTETNLSLSPKFLAPCINLHDHQVLPMALLGGPE